MTLEIRHLQLPNGKWVARCDMHRGWKYRSPELDKNGAAQSLRFYHAERLQFTHWPEGEVST